MGNRVVVVVIGILGLVGGCTKRNPAVCCTSATDCAAQGLPEGTSCADGLTCVRNQCEAPVGCEADSDCADPTPLCSTDGICVECIDSSTCGDRVCDTAIHTCRECTSDDECSTGFCSPATNTCAPGTLTPRYLPTICDTPATTELHITSDNQSVECSEIVPQSAGPSICVVRHTRITVAPSVTWRRTGGAALAVVADDEVTIDGILDVSASGTTSGPGGSFTSSGGNANNTEAAGGGGAGFKTAGGHGGTIVDGGANNGGPPRDAVSASELLAGARSGTDLMHGGGGGGAVTLIACRGHVSVSGMIAANGGGGDGGAVLKFQEFGHGGWGGGSGGNVVLQGRRVTVTGQLFANGGGGGGGGKPNTSDTAVGDPGSDGLRAETCAPGGRMGGDGGCFGKLPKNGTKWRVVMGAQSQPSAGGGGGSVGYLQVYTPEGVAPTLTPSAVSPGFEPPGTIPTH